MNYHVAYQHCTEDLGQHPVDSWLQAQEKVDSAVVFKCGDLQMINVHWKYYPVEEGHPCANKVNKGYAVGQVSYFNKVEGWPSTDVQFNHKPLPGGPLLRLRWKLFNSQYRFCVEDKAASLAIANKAYLEMDYVEQFICFRGIPYVYGPRYTGKVVEA